ncbi:hypothetical protein DID78_02100 [Candidatus Marinamargulisbacteria bacterium SCGC AG-343-D04]|nr:hypothetical protein DID78_02100 [Candidatus Marinamargulisbacteria bacterium SCGC AG-343-D04]
MINEYKLVIPKSIKEQLFEHALSINPIESCGYLGGKDGEVTVFYPMTNVDNSPEHFSFDPKEQFATVKSARNEGLSLIGVYHSHPETPARLSDEDLKLFNDPDPVYIIVSLKNEKPDMAGFKIFKEDENTIEVHKVNLIERGD